MALLYCVAIIVVFRQLCTSSHTSTFPLTLKKVDVSVRFVVKPVMMVALEDLQR